MDASKWNSWWSRRSSNLIGNDNEPAFLGIDAGSKTIKLVAADEAGDIVFALYHRHRSDVLTTLADLAHDAIWRYGDKTLPVAVTGSAGIALAQALNVPFVQEVVATTSAVKKRYPEADCIIELGGEDAKITYLGSNVEQRMNATCAGGTGDFIDSIASMLGIRTREISKLALGSSRTYPIASRCAVFAQTDMRPLVNSGARKADIAQSALEAVAKQTLGGLACGRPIRGTVVFLGGPLEHIPALVMTFRRKLGLNKDTGIKPPDAHLYAALGAIETADAAPRMALSELERRARQVGSLDDNADHLPALFENPEELQDFRERHAAATFPRKSIADAEGALFLGLDAGSTTVKCVLMDSTGAVVASDYQDVEGDAFEAAKRMVEQLLVGIEGAGHARQRRFLAHATATGYGEELLRTGLGFDSGVVETVAHLRAAQQFRPDASFVLDIGGQDMKALWIRDGVVVDAVLNEACSSGCGAFVQSSAKSLNMSRQEFSRLAMEAKHPIDLGAKCTVFMTSRVRHAQKASASVGDIAAGIAYSVVNNVMTRVIGKTHALPLGNAVVVQGGTFKSDAVLRAFEKTAGVSAFRPGCAHLMGAYGCALIARDRWLGRNASETQVRLEGDANGRRSSVPGLAEIHHIAAKRMTMRCAGCGNSCLLSIIDFRNGRHLISGNRCDRAYESVFGTQGEQHRMPKAPNIVALEQKLVAAFSDHEATGLRGRTTVGIMNTLGTYENTPFWHTLFAELGFSIVVPDDSIANQLADQAAETIPSESACFPAKLSHMRYAALVRAGADFVFMPTHERGTRCPVACGYARALRDNVGSSRMLSPQLRAIRPRSIVARESDCRELCEAIGRMLPATDPLNSRELERALSKALDAQNAFEDTIARGAEKALEWARHDDERRVAIVAGRPYHMDPTVLHGIDRELVRLGFAVLPQMAVGLAQQPVSRRKTSWKPAKHLVGLVERFAGDFQVEIVALRSFGCGYDAVSADEAHDAAFTLHRPFTELKIDEIVDTAHVRIRLRTLEHTTRLRAADSGAAGGIDRAGNAPLPISGQEAPAGAQPAPPKRTPATASFPTGAPTPDLCSTAKTLVQRAMDKAPTLASGEALTVPITCRDCLVDALPFELEHALGFAPPVNWVNSTAGACEQAGCAHNAEGRPKVGLLGNPLLVFDSSLNDDIAQLVGQLGWQPVFPDPHLVEVEDVHYIQQLEAFRAAGVQRVVYLQSFGCLKGHVQSRGALHELQRMFPELHITVIDYDPESSALNRENRIRLALS